MNSKTDLDQTKLENKNVVSFALKPRIRFLRAVIPVMSKLLPQATARWCMNLFLTPGRQATPSWELANQVYAKINWVEISGKRVKVFCWGQGARKVLLCHGWGGRGLQLSEFAVPLVQLGYQVIAFDAIGHGESDGHWTDMQDYSSIIDFLSRTHGPFHACIGHSFGAGNILYAQQQYHLMLPRIILLSCFDHGQWVVDTFAKMLNVPPAIWPMMKDSHEKKRAYQLRWAQFDMVAMAMQSNSKILLVHDLEDKEIPYQHSQSFMIGGDPRISLYTTRDLGHRRILRSPQVIDHICQFVDAA